MGNLDKLSKYKLIIQQEESYFSNKEHCIEPTLRELCISEENLREKTMNSSQRKVLAVQMQKRILLISEGMSIY